MASIFRSLFSSKSTTTSNHRVKGHSYDSAVALDPPVRGSYPVAGNGPNVLEEIQRSRAQRDTSSARRQTSVAAAPHVPRYREDIVERPKTAPNDGDTDGGYSKRSSKIGSGSWAGRTRSGFSTKSPPSILGPSNRSDKRDSIKSPVEPPLPSVHILSAEPKPQAYQPKKVTTSETSDNFNPLFPQHIRITSNSPSRKSYVDLLEAQSTIRPETSKHRVKASGVRNYGEDVADRNIDRFGAGTHAQLDLNSPQFSYMKTVYTQKRRPIADVVGTGSHSRVSSALGHILGDDGPRDDISPRNYGNAASIRSQTAPRTSLLRNETTPPVAYTASRGQENDGHSSTAVSSHDQRGNGFSQLSQVNTAQHFNEDQSTMRSSIGRPIHPSQSRDETREQGNFSQEPPPAPLAYKPKSPPPQGISKQTSPSLANHTVKRMPAMPVTHESPIRSYVSMNSNEQRQFNSGPVNQSTFLSVNNRAGNNIYMDSTDHTTRPPSTTKSNKRQGLILENSSAPPKLDGMMDLSNTVDTDVTTRTLPAVTHEHVTPVRHEVKEERILREIHTHEVRHHILPVLDTEVLPAKHYVQSPDGNTLVEIPESEVPRHKSSGSMNGTWSFTKRPYSTRSRTSSLTHASVHRSQPQPLDAEADESQSAEAPVIGLVRDPNTRSRANSRASNHTAKPSRALKNIFTEPVLASKKEYMTEEGHPRTEFVWRHPPVFEDASGRTQPVKIDAGLSNLDALRGQFIEDSPRKEGRSPTPQNEESLLFRDSGYGSMGNLPGLSALAPMSGFKIDGTVEDEEGGKVGNVMIAGSAESEAAEAYRRTRKRSRSSAARMSASSSVKGGSMPHVGDLVRGVDGMHV